MAASLSVKLQLKPGQHLTLNNVPRQNRPRLAGVPLSTKRTGAGALLVFVTSMSEVKALARKAVQRMGRDGMLWIAYPKGTSGIESDVNRDRLWEEVKKTGWEGVRLVSIDEVWSAMRFRPTDHVRS